VEKAEGLIEMAAYIEEITVAHESDRSESVTEKRERMRRKGRAATSVY